MTKSTTTAPCIHSACRASDCRQNCALEVIDELLRAQRSVQGGEVDALLDLRWVLRHRVDAEAAMTLFCQLRRTMEEKHYLSFYRLRRWFENQIEASVRMVRGAPERTVALKLNWYCPEAIRFQCLNFAKETGEPALAPRVRFAFRKVSHSEAGEKSSFAVALTLLG